MKNLHYLHYCYGKNELGKNNSYGNYLEKRADKGDYQFNKYFFFFNIWWLARHRMYTMIFLYVIPVMTVIYFFITSSPEGSGQEWFLKYVLFRGMPYLASIHIFFCYISYKALTTELDSRFWKERYDLNSVRDKIQPLSYIFTPIMAGFVTYFAIKIVQELLLLVN